MYRLKKYPMILVDKKGKKYQVYVGFITKLTHFIIPLNQVPKSMHLDTLDFKGITEIDLQSVIHQMNQTLLGINEWEI